jgi:anti-sigma factor ChrR (cupin superfamily)
MPIDERGNALLTLNEMKWVAGPPTLPGGVRMFVIEGDPREAGPFTMRLWFPAGTRVAPHFHPGVEHVTVISGSAHWGMGERFEANELRTMQTTEDTVVQAHGTGPWRTIYVNPADDPTASAGGR